MPGEVPGEVPGVSPGRFACVTRDADEVPGVSPADEAGGRGAGRFACVTRDVVPGVSPARAIRRFRVVSNFVQMAHGDNCQTIA